MNVGWVEVNRVLSSRGLPKPIKTFLVGPMMGFAKKKRVKNALFSLYPSYEFNR